MIQEPVPSSTQKIRTARFQFFRATLLEDSSFQMRPCVTGRAVQSCGRTVSPPFLGTNSLLLGMLDPE